MIYVDENKIPKTCAECEHCTKAHEGKFGIPFCNVTRMPIYDGQDVKGRGHHTDSLSDFDCPLKTIQSVQNEKAVDLLKKVKEDIISSVPMKSIDENDGMRTTYQIAKYQHEQIDKLIAELKGEKNEKENN